MVGVSAEGDLVIIDLKTRRTDVLLSVAAAEEFARALRVKAAEAMLGEPQVRTGKQWELQIQSYDGKVALRFLTAEPASVVRVDAVTARKMAGKVDFEAQQARHKMRFVFTGVGGRQFELNDVAKQQKPRLARMKFGTRRGQS